MTTLLLVEDDTKIAHALCIRFKSAGYEVVTSPDALHAMGQARRHKPDVAILDINLPGGDGFLVAHRLRSMQITATTPIIFVTASRKPGLKSRARELGAVAFIEKPFSATQLLDAIELASYGGESFYETA